MSIGQKEVWLNKTKIFIKSTMFYLLAFLLLSISWIAKPKFLKLAALIMLVFGSILHSYGIILRVIIMAIVKTMKEEKKKKREHRRQKM